MDFRVPSGKANGLTRDKKWRLIACEHENLRVSLMEADGTIVILYHRHDYERNVTETGKEGIR